jgi:hypothetical protein
MTTPQNPVDLSEVRAADPVRMADLPSSSSQHAQALLQQTMQGAMPNVAPSPTGLRARLPLLGAVAAAALLVAATFAVLSPSSTRPAVATVKAAAQEVATAESGRAITTFSLQGSDGVENVAASGQIELLFNGDDIAVTLDLNDVPNQLEGEGAEFFSGIETRIVDGVLYLKGGPSPDWIGLDLPQIFLDQIDTVDPRSILDTVQTLVAAQEVGTDTIAGVDVTVYESTVDLSDPSLSASGWMSGLESQLDLETDGTITVTLSVDDAEQLRRIVVSGDLTGGQDVVGSATFSISTDFTDLNAVDRIVAPDGVVASPMFDGFGDSEDN